MFNIKAFSHRLMKIPDSVFALLASAILIPFFYFSPHVLSYVHQFLNIIVSSRSTVKVFLIAIFLSVLFLARDFLPVPKLLKDKAKPIFITLVAFVFVLNCLSFIGFTAHYALPLSDQTIVFNNGEVSSIRLIHNHVLKGVFAPLLLGTTHGYYENADVGTAFTGLSPALFFWVVFALMIAIVIFSIYAYLELLLQYQSISSARAVTVLFGVALFGLIVRLIDGGIFADGVLAYLLVISILLWRGDSVVYKRLFFGSVVYLAIICGLTYFHFFTGWDELWHRVTQNIIFVIIALPFFAHLYLKKSGRLVVLLSVAAFLSVILMIVKDDGPLTYLQMPIRPGTVVSMYEKPKDDGYILKEQIGKLSFYEPNKQALSGMHTVGDLLKRNDLHDNFYPISVPFETCIPTSPPTSFEFTIATKSTLEAFPHPSYIQVASFSRIDTRAGLNHYRVRLVASACWPRFINVLDEIIKNNMSAPTFVYAFNFE